VAPARPGDRSSSLLVSVIRENTGTRPDWSRQSLGGTGGWLQAELSFQLLAPFQVMFAVDLGVNGSRIALDDVSVSESGCSGGKGWLVLVSTITIYV